MSPQALAVGKNVITLTTAELRNNTILYGEIIVKTAVNRRIYILRSKIAQGKHAWQLPSLRFLWQTNHNTFNLHIF